MHEHDNYLAPKAFLLWNLGSSTRYSLRLFVKTWLESRLLRAENICTALLEN